MDNTTIFLKKLDFNTFFDLEISQYGRTLDEANRSGQHNFDMMIKAKDLFRDNLFAWVIKMIKHPTQVVTLENVKDVVMVREFIKHSKITKQIHTCVSNEVLERILDVISKPNSEQSNKGT